MRFAFFIFFTLLTSPLFALAHESIVVGKEEIVITDPERGRVYFGELVDGQSRTYHIVTDTPWHLYLSLLVPEAANPNGKYDALIYDVGRGQIVSLLEQGDAPWYPYYELFGADHYLQGPRLLKEMPEGNFDVIITSKDNAGRYALVIGDEEVFSLREMSSLVSRTAANKKNFFGVSPATFLASPLGIFYALFLLGLGSIFGSIFRYAVRFIKKDRGVSRAEVNIGLRDRLVRLGIGLIFFFVAVTTSWNPLLFIAAGFCFYQALVKWCGFFALMGKRTCDGF